MELKTEHSIGAPKSKRAKRELSLASRPSSSHNPPSLTYHHTPSSVAPLTAVKFHLPPTNSTLRLNGLLPDDENDTYVARSPIVSMNGVGECVQRLIKLNEEQRRHITSNSLNDFWKPFVAKYFTPSARMLIDMYDSRLHTPTSVEISAELLPRVWKSKYDLGIKEERLLMENPCEFILQNGIVVVDCPRALILTVYPNSKICTEGHLRVSFEADFKIHCWEFSTRHHEELVVISSNDEQHKATANSFGMAPDVLQYLRMAESVNAMKPVIAQALGLHVGGKGRPSGGDGGGEDSERDFMDHGDGDGGSFGKDELIRMMNGRIDGDVGFIPSAFHVESQRIRQQQHQQHRAAGAAVLDSTTLLKQQQKQQQEKLKLSSSAIPLHVSLNETAGETEKMNRDAKRAAAVSQWLRKSFAEENSSQVGSKKEVNASREDSQSMMKMIMDQLNDTARGMPNSGGAVTTGTSSKCGIDGGLVSGIADELDGMYGVVRKDGVTTSSNGGAVQKSRSNDMKSTSNVEKNINSLHKKCENESIHDQNDNSMKHVE